VSEVHVFAKLTEAAAQDIRTKRLNQPQFCKLYGVDQSTVSNIQRGTRWKPAPLPAPPGVRG